jgi:hypothetical protein
MEFGSNVMYMPRNFKLQLLLWPFILIIICSISYNSRAILQMFRQVKKMEKQLTEATHRSQKMLLLSVWVEFILALIAIVIPLTIVLLAIAFPIPYGSHISCILFTLMSFQTLMSAVLQCYYIRPFRKGIKELLTLQFIKTTQVGMTMSFR